MTHSYLYCIEIYIVGHRGNLHSNQNIQASESYHVALKR